MISDSEDAEKDKQRRPAQNGGRCLRRFYPVSRIDAASRLRVTDAERRQPRGSSASIDGLSMT